MTSWKDPIQHYHRFMDQDLFQARQLLGQISKEELREVNQVYGAKHGVEFWNHLCEPAGLWANNKMISYTLLGGAYLGLGHCKFVLGYNIFWLAFPFLPFWAFQFYQAKRQPK